MDSPTIRRRVGTLRLKTQRLESDKPNPSVSFGSSFSVIVIFWYVISRSCEISALPLSPVLKNDLFRDTLILLTHCLKVPA